MAEQYSKDPQDENKLIILHDPEKSVYTMEQLKGMRDSAQSEVDKWKALIDEAVGVGVKAKP